MINLFRGAYELPVSCMEPEHNCQYMHVDIVIDHAVNNNSPLKVSKSSKKNEYRKQLEGYTIRNVHMRNTVIGTRYFIDLRRKINGDTSMIYYRPSSDPNRKDALVVKTGPFQAAIQEFSKKIFEIFTKELNTNLPGPLISMIISYLPEEEAIVFALNNFSKQFVLRDYGLEREQEEQKKRADRMLD